MPALIVRTQQVPVRCETLGQQVIRLDAPEAETMMCVESPSPEVVDLEDDGPECLVLEHASVRFPKSPPPLIRNHNHTQMESSNGKQEILSPACLPTPVCKEATTVNPRAEASVVRSFTVNLSKRLPETSTYNRMDPS